MDIVLLCAGLIIFGIIMYVILDGFDLGIGIIFPWAPTDQCKNRMMSSIAPVWDGNETWLIYGTGVLFAAFPKAYSIIIPALYAPIMLIVTSLIFRGLAFEFRLKAIKSRWIWDWSFIIGSYIATFSQGIIIGAIVEGINSDAFKNCGNSLIFLNPFTITTGFAMIIAYGLLGSTWVIMKTQGITRKWAQNITKPILIMVILFIIMISVKTPYQHDFIAERWFNFPNILFLSPVPFLTGLSIYLILFGIKRQYDYLPFISAISIFILCFFGLGISLWPYIIIPDITIWDASAPPETLKFVSIVICISLPIVIGYSIFVYSLFKGKVTDKENLY